MGDTYSALIRRIYAGALQLDPEERDEYLDRECAIHPGLRTQVQALLDSHAHELDDRSTRTITSLSAVAAPGEEMAGRKIGPYEIQRVLGRGGMGIVFLARDTHLGRDVAIKKINPALSHSPGVQERLVNEARLAAGLSHQGIATVYAFERFDDEWYLIGEYVHGNPLRALVEAGPLPIKDVVDIGLQLANALAVAHTKAIVHRDIKPENAIRTPSGVVKLLDFGLARIEYAPGLTADDVIVGTPAYLAPEQVDGRPADFRTDIFALGLLLYELASGRNPFVAESISVTIARIRGDNPPPLSYVQPDSVPDLDRIIERCLRKDPNARYGSTQELIADLDAVKRQLFSPHGSGWEGLRPAPPSAATKWLINHQVIMSGVYVILLYPVWYARGWLAAPWNMWFLLAVLAAVAAGTSLRLHLVFIALTSPAQLREQQLSTGRWTRVCDVIFASTQAAGALAFGSGHPEFAMLFVCVSVAVLVTTFVIEPATVRTALTGRGGDR